MASRPVEPGFFRAVSEATLTRRRIAIRHYTRSRDEYTDREVSPQRLVFYRGNWYLDAWCHLRQGLRSFGIDAIRKISVTDKAAREVDTAALDTHLGAGYGIPLTDEDIAGVNLAAHAIHEPPSTRQPKEFAQS